MSLKLYLKYSTFYVQKIYIFSKKNILHFISTTVKGLQHTILSVYVSASPGCTQENTIFFQTQCIF